MIDSWPGWHLTLDFVRLVPTGLRLTPCQTLFPRSLTSDFPTALVATSRPPDLSRQSVLEAGAHIRGSANGVRHFMEQSPDVRLERPELVTLDDDRRRRSPRSASCSRDEDLADPGRSRNASGVAVSGSPSAAWPYAGA